MNITLPQLVDLLRAFINARPGFDPANYFGAPEAYRADARTAQQQRHDALRMLVVFECHAFPPRSAYAGEYLQALLDQLRRGRLNLRETTPGRSALEYCAGQYYPTEYRGAACRVLAGALWDVQRETLQREGKTVTVDTLRASVTSWFGHGIASRWFRY